MAPGARILRLSAAVLTLVPILAGAQVFVVGEHSATADVASDFTPTNVPLSSDRLTERGSRDLERMLVAEQGFAHRALPLGAGLTLQANGALSPGPQEYRHILFQKGQAAAAGDRVQVTALVLRGNRLIVDVNGGPYAKHRFLSHVQLNNSSAAPQEQATGARVTLVFPHGIPDITAPEVKALLEPVIDFGVKSSEQAYADTLPPALRNAIAAHEVLVGMSHRMVLAALGQPDSKVHERAGEDVNGSHYEEWIYGHVPQTVRFVRFAGDRVNLLEIAELGKPIQIHDKDELGGYHVPGPTREIKMGDLAKGPEDGAPPAPSLRMPGEAVPAPAAGGSGRVQMPKPKDSTSPSAGPSQP